MNNSKLVTIRVINDLKNYNSLVNSLHNQISIIYSTLKLNYFLINNQSLHIMN